MSTSYDFIVIGGGTAGLVVAARLSEVPNFRILVLEAGVDHSSDLRVQCPALYTTLLGSEADWGFQTELQVRENESWGWVSQFHRFYGRSDISLTQHRRDSAVDVLL